jgi:hypothetical protein
MAAQPNALSVPLLPEPLPSITRSGATLVDWSISFENPVSTPPDLAGSVLADVLLPGLDGLVAAMAAEQPTR